MSQAIEQALWTLQQAVEGASPKQKAHLLPLLEQLKGLLTQHEAADEKGRAALRPSLDTVLRLIEDLSDGAVSR